MITKNESKVLRMLLMAFGEEYSINRIAKVCGLSPNGALKTLRKFESQGILTVKKIANINSYKINFSNNKTKNILELALIPEIPEKIKYRYDDLGPLKKITEIGIIFGSYITDKQKPTDIDLFFVLDKKNFNEYKTLSKKIYFTMPLKVQDVLQTKKDLKENILKKDKVIIEIFRKGIILWGYDKIIKFFENDR
ncbi:MAG TPA: nucleotidyltransferase domain-containing protein [Candidatus Nanoarchaeia archaeon]|nr:nucleotidyltransferase domain-containing protein [Candidatus Nanoarchaeia archaeon]